MGFWFFMLAMDLLLPLTMLGFGRFFMKRAPRNINPIFGYRTAMSMKNRDTWEFAHHYCGKIWFYCGLAALPLSGLSMILVIGRNETTISAAGCAVCLAQLIPLLLSVIFTENALKKRFDSHGIRR